MKVIWPRVIYVWIILILMLFNLICIHVPVKTIIGECANCNMDGMIAVGNVIRNRSKYQNKSFNDVCLAKNQFSFWNDKQKANAFLFKNKNVIYKAFTAWQISANKDITKGADHYYADYIKPPKWAKSMTYTAKHDKHLFYRS